MMIQTSDIYSLHVYVPYSIFIHISNLYFMYSDIRTSYFIDCSKMCYFMCFNRTDSMDADIKIEY